MSEKEIIKRAKDELILAGWVAWKPPKVAYYESDIFGIFDLVACFKMKIMFIQVTSLSNLAHRRRKILNFFNENKVCIPESYVWAWDEDGKVFKKELVLITAT